MADEPRPGPDDEEDDRAPERPARRRREPREEEQELARAKPGAGAIICAVLGGLLLLVGLSAFPGVLAKFGEEDVSHVMGRLICVGVEFVLGIALLLPLIRSSTRDRSEDRARRRRDDEESEGW